MNRSSSTPATFIATPCTPAGNPKRKSDRMIAQSGLFGIDREKCTATRPVIIIQMPATDASVAAIDVPSAAPCAPNPGIGPAPRMRTMFSAMFRPTIHSPIRSGVRESPADLSAPASMK